jgi:hypothetical protein
MTIQSLGSASDLDDLLLLQFVFRTEDKPCLVVAGLETVYDQPSDRRSKRSHDIRYQIVGEWPVPFARLAWTFSLAIDPAAFVDAPSQV